MEQDIIILDFEVFYEDILLGCLITHADNTYDIIQTWDKEEMKNLYHKYYNNIWVTHNGEHYDNRIFEAVLKNENPFEISQNIISGKISGYSNLKLFTYDMLNSVLAPWSLKVSEAVTGKAIDTTEVSFDLRRKLTSEERELTEKYNQSDLFQTWDNFKKFGDKFKLRIDMITDFHIDLRKGLKWTDTRLIEEIFRVVQDKSLEYNIYERKLYPELRIKNQKVIDWYLDKNYLNSDGIQVNFGDYTTDVLKGGLHGARKKSHFNKVIEIDVASLYPSLIIEYNLYPRSMSEENKKTYKDMYYERLRIKKTDPRRQKILKKILNSVYGASNSKFSGFYDPSMEFTIAATGEIFMLDLMEKLEPYVHFVQNNTDGIAFIPKDWAKEDFIKSIINEWETRTRLKMDYDYLYNFWQRDVNNYCCKTTDGKIICKGEVFKTNDVDDDAFIEGTLFNYKEPPIVGRGVLECFLNNTTPENTIKNYQNNLLMFAYVCKKNTFDKLTYQIQNLKDLSVAEYDIQSPTRVFANKNNTNVGMIYKYKTNKLGKAQISKVSNLPNNVFIWNKEIKSEENINIVKNKLDYQYYINRIYERINEFI